jgi:hypothetical protein
VQIKVIIVSRVQESGNTLRGSKGTVINRRTREDALVLGNDSVNTLPRQQMHEYKTRETVAGCFLCGLCRGYIKKVLEQATTSFDREKPFIENTRCLNLAAVRRTTVQVTGCFSEWLH